MNKPKQKNLNDVDLTTVCYWCKNHIDFINSKDYCESSADVNERFIYESIMEALYG